MQQSSTGRRDWNCVTSWCVQIIVFRVDCALVLQVNVSTGSGLFFIVSRVWYYAYCADHTKSDHKSDGAVNVLKFVHLEVYVELFEDFFRFCLRIFWGLFLRIFLGYIEDLCVFQEWITNFLNLFAFSQTVRGLKTLQPSIRLICTGEKKMRERVPETCEWSQKAAV